MVRNIATVLLVAIIFTFMHISFMDFSVSDLLANIPIFILGLTLTVLRLKTSNIICPILVHIAVNCVGRFG